MIRAYNELYLSTVYRNIGALFDIAVYCEDLDPSGFAFLFASSSVARGIEAGSPRYLAGMSPQDMFSEIVLSDPGDRIAPGETTDACWAGYVLAYSQWYCGCTFREILEKFPLDRMISLHHTLRDDIMNAVSIVIDTLHPVTILKELRERRGLSQSDLALLSGVPIRSIRAYEQGTVELCKAQGDTLFSLAKVLGCPVDILIKG